MTRVQADRVALYAIRRYIHRRRPGMTALEELSLIYGDRTVLNVFERFERRFGRRWRWFR